MPINLHLPKQPTITMLFLILVSIAGGILFSSQWQVRTLRVVNPIQPYTSLTETRDALNEEQQNLKVQIADVVAKVEQRKSDLTDTNQIDVNLADRSKYTLVDAGLTKVEGPGVEAIIDDSKTGVLTEQAIAHAADLRDLVSLLQGIGAEAIAINGERVITTTAIDCIVNTILVNETRLANPYIVTAIGDAETMQKVVSDPSVLQDLHRRVVTDGVQFSVEQKEKIVIPAFAGSLPGDNVELSL